MRWFAILFTILLAPLAAEAGTKVVVMRVEGNADGITKKSLEYQLLDVARHVDPKATQVDFTFTDATATTSCTGELEKCKGAVLDEFGVDEMLVAKADTQPDGTTRITVQRARKSGVQQVAFTGTRDGLANEVPANVGTWYGVKAGAAPAKGPAMPPPPGTTETAGARPAVTKTSPPPPPPPPADASEPPPPAGAKGPVAAKDHAAADTRTASATEPEAATAPASEPADESARHHGSIYLGGVIGGGLVAVVGLVLWNRASATQDDIDRAPTSTAADLRHLMDLESTGRSYALWGNVTVVAGVAIAATCGVLYWRARGREGHSVALAPSVSAHGGGVTLTIGGL